MKMEPLRIWVRNLETKADIRKRILSLRLEQPQEEQNKRSQEIQKRILNNKHFCTSEWIFLYMAYKAEVQTEMLLEQALKMGKRVALPKVEDTTMDFYEIRSKIEVQPGYFGILEPITSDKVKAGQGFMAVPGVAFSKDGYRLGYGKGFYDRYLARFPGIYSCGLAFSCQMLENLPVQKHDRKLDEVVYV